MPRTGHAEGTLLPAPLDGAGAFPALPQSCSGRMSLYPVPVGRAIESPSEKDYQNIQLCFPFCLSRLLLMVFVIV